MVAINNDVNNTVGTANTGVTNTLLVTNSSNTASSAAVVSLDVGGATASDAQITYTVSGITSWCHGIDNSVTSPTVDPFVISQGTALGTNNIMSIATSGEINYPLQSAFLATAGAVTNVTGDGTLYTQVYTSEIFDQNSDFNGTTTFTAPVTGRYHIDFLSALTSVTASTNWVFSIVTTNRSYSGNLNPLTAKNVGGATIFNLSSLCDMTAGDTCTTTIVSTGEAGKTSGANANVKFSAILIC